MYVHIDIETVTWQWKIDYLYVIFPARNPPFHSWISDCRVLDYWRVREHLQLYPWFLP